MYFLLYVSRTLRLSGLIFRGLNFINFLRTAFTSADPIRVKKTVKLWIFFTLSGSTSVEAARKTLVKLTSGLNFINVLRTAFKCVDPRSLRIQSNPQYLFTLLGSTCAKAARKMLMKSTPGLHFPGYGYSIISGFGVIGSARVFVTKSNKKTINGEQFFKGRFWIIYSVAEMQALNVPKLKCTFHQTKLNRFLFFKYFLLNYFIEPKR